MKDPYESHEFMDLLIITAFTVVVVVIVLQFLIHPFK